MRNGNPSIETMLAHRDWIQRLALRLVADPNDAEDVVQETWVAALRNPPPDDGRSRRGWLVRVAQNAARGVARSRRTRRHHERAASVRDATPSSEELVDRLSVERSVVEDVVALPEPYRHTILLRYFEGLLPRAIAARTDIPVETVKTRLQRGLELLRGRLDRRHGGDASAWLLALTPVGMKGGASSALGTGALLVSAKAWVGLATVLTALALGFFLWWDVTPTPRGASEPRTPAVAALADEQVPEQALAVEESPDPRARADLAGVTPGQTVRVVSALDGSALPGADVWFIDAEMGQKLADEWRRAGDEVGYYDSEPALREHGRHVVCDDRGEATLPRSDTSWRLIARSADLYGRASPSADGPIEIRCARERHIAVQVVDASGTPLSGVIVGLRENDDWVRWRQRTGAPDGIAHFRHWGTGPATSLRPGSALFAILGFPNAGGVARPVDLEALEEPIRLVAPDTGRLVVDLEDGDGRPYAAQAWVEAMRLYETPGRERVTARDTRHTVHLRGASQAVYTHVGLGFDLLVAVPRHGIMKRVERVVPGPTRRGEELRVKIEVEDRMAHFSGRVSVPPGTEFELAAVDVDADYWDGERWQHASVGGPVLSGAVVLEDGRFLLPLDDRVPEGARCRLSFKGDAQDAVQLSAKCDALAPADGEGRDCGTITLASAPLVAAGRVTDQAGRPLPGVRLSLGKKRLARQPPADFVWSLHESSAGQTDDEGRFELRGDQPPDEYAILARSSGHADRGWVPFPFGGQDVRVVLDAEARVSGHILVDEGFSVERLTVVAIYPEEERPPHSTFSLVTHITHVQPGGQFSLSGLRPGSPRVLVRTGLYSDPLASIENVELRPGEATTDERVSRIDLRGAAFETTLEVVGPDGEPVGLGFVALADSAAEPGVEPGVEPGAEPGAEPRRSRFAIEDGRVSLITGYSPVDVEVFSPGLVPALLPGLRDDTRVVLDQGLRVQLSLPEDIQLPHAPYGLRVGLLRADRGNRPGTGSRDPAVLSAMSSVCLRDCEEFNYRRNDLEWSYGVFDADRRLELGVPRAGLYDVVWEILDIGGARLRTSPLRAERETRQLEVTSWEASFEIAPDREAYDRSLTSLR